MSIQSNLVKFVLRRSGMWSKPLQEIRDNMQKMKAKSFPEGIDITDDTVNGIPCKVFFHKERDAEKVIIYYHGGGFCLGICDMNTALVAEIAERTGMDAYMPDYRLAPEHLYPAALNDAVDFYQGILNEGYAAEDIIVMGDSSGCALAVSALLLLGKDGVKMPRALAFISPVFDLAGKGETLTSLARKDPFQLEDPLGVAKNYIAGVNPEDPSVSPLYGELHCLPPVLIHAADYDVFLSDSLRFENRLLALKKDIRLKVWKKMWHIFHLQFSLVPESNKALEELCDDIKQRFR